MAPPSPEFPTVERTDALIVIDMQNDFLPGGPLGVAGGDSLLPGINALARRFDHVILTQDWHPVGHVSFASTYPGKQPFADTITTAYGVQALWPDHCVQGSRGAEFHPSLAIPQAELILRKGFRSGIDSYSAFLENDRATPTGLAGYLRERGLRRLFFCGLAFDFCVGYSALDAVHFGFEAVVVSDLSRAVDLEGSHGKPGSAERMRARLASDRIEQIGTHSLL